MATYNVTLIDEARGLNKTIQVLGNETILDVSDKHEMDLPFSCRAGACATCTGKLTKGSVNQDQQCYLDDEQTEAGYVLLCVAFPTSDCTIELGKRGKVQK